MTPFLLFYSIAYVAFVTTIVTMGVQFLRKPRLTPPALPDPWEGQQRFPVPIVNGVPKFVTQNHPVGDVIAWAELEGIEWNNGHMTMTADQSFAFRMRFE